MTRWIRAVFMLSIAVSLFAVGQVKEGKKEQPKGLTFDTHIEPILKKYCLPCHLSENENPSGLSLDNYELLIKGGNHDNTVVPGKPKESNFYLKLLPNPPFGKQMARNRKKLSPEEIKTIYDWLEQGAKEK